MSSERIFGPSAALPDRLQPLGSVFQRLWPADPEGRFGKLLRRIDDAFIEHRSRVRIARLNRILERRYSA